MSDARCLVLVAPNWLGDGVMALPAVADVRLAFPASRLVVAARKTVAELFRLSPAVDEVLPLQWTGRWWRRGGLAADTNALRRIAADVAILFPNSFASAWVVERAAIPERWGFATDLRRRLLSRAVRRPPHGLHQGAYYQYLTAALGAPSGPLEPVVVVPHHDVDGSRTLLREKGWDGSSPIVVLAPGAAYGAAKRWIPAYVAELAEKLIRDGVVCVMVGGPGDMATARHVADLMPAATASRLIDLTGATSVAELAAVLSLARVCVSNDSGAMHLAAATGTAVVAMFGPTNERETAPLARNGARAEVLVHDVWCRPCMLRECPIDHRCMTGISPARVFSVVHPLASGDRAS